MVQRKEAAYRLGRAGLTIGLMLVAGFFFWRIFLAPSTDPSIIAAGVMATILVLLWWRMQWLEAKRAGRRKNFHKLRRAHQFFVLPWLWTLVYAISLGTDGTLIAIWTALLGFACLQVGFAFLGLSIILLPALNLPEVAEAVAGLSAFVIVLWTLCSLLLGVGLVLSADGRSNWEKREDSRIEKRHLIAEMNRETGRLYSQRQPTDNSQEVARLSRQARATDARVRMLQAQHRRKQDD